MHFPTYMFPEPLDICDPGEPRLYLSGLVSRIPSLPPYRQLLTLVSRSALRAVRAELDDIFDSDSSPAAVNARLLAPGGEQLVHRMSYASAVIKETLRLWPPGATARMTQPGDGLKVTMPAYPTSPGTDNSEVLLDGIMLYHVHSIMQRDPAVFGETADIFVPERWLQDDATEKIPTGAWRAFERGPRNCIGQELATIEARVMLAMAARRYDFTKVGLGAVARDGATDEPTLGMDGQFEVAEELYMVSLSTPSGGVMFFY